MKAKARKRSRNRTSASAVAKASASVSKRVSPPRPEALPQPAAALQSTTKRLEKNAHALHRQIELTHQHADEVHEEAERQFRAAPKETGKRSRSLFPIVGIGASAGGLEAATQLLQSLPKNTGMAFVLVQHLDPTHESALSVLLSRTTSMAVSEARHNVLLEPDHLYIIPPDKLIGIAERKLRLLPRKEGKHFHSPIDYFLRALAAAEGSSAIGVILSGNGSDGTSGLQEIKAAGGTTFAQEEATAKYPAMPGSAIAGRCVDFVLPPQQIARELVRINGHPYLASAQPRARARPAPTEEKAFEDILVTLRHRLGVDFTHYKHATLQRRIQRRMMLHKIEKQKEYAEYLRSHVNEARELFNDILIHVTGFFRDPALFATLKKKIFPRLLKKQRHGEPLRIWVPGCSTGEEVYSIAMALVESFKDNAPQPLIQIFGTDVNDRALDKARAGFYPGSISENVLADRLRRFFVKADGGYRVNKSIREMCIFARQNVAMDPPFSKLDLISCRNVLIYLGQPLQRKIMPIFHYALKPNGLLVLGASETIGIHADLFQLVEAKGKIYAKKSGHPRLGVAFGQYQPVLPALEIAPARPAEVPPDLADVHKQADRILLNHFSPAGVVIDKKMDVLQFRGRTGLYLEHAHGEASLNLLKMARDGLGMDLRAAVSKAMKQNGRVRHEGARVKQNGQVLEVSIEVVPFQIPLSRESYYLVILDGSPSPGARAEPAKGGKGRTRLSVEGLELKRLREELDSSRESLQAIIEEQEATNEELRSANEEITSSNEELQSTNEELETAKEELQSTNEELTTLNEELESRNTEMDGVNNDLQNVLTSTSIPMLILGPDLRIRRFTPMAEELFNLIPSDVGRPITDIHMLAQVPSLSKLVGEVLDNLATKEADVQGNDSRWYSLRIRPYKTSDNRIDGVVIAVVDIDAMKGRMNRSNRARAFAEAIVNTVRQPLMVLNNRLSVRHVNEAFLRGFQVTEEETVNKRVYDLGNGQWNIPKLRTLLEEILPNNSTLRDFEVEHDFPRIGKKRMILNAQRLVFEGEPEELIVLAIEEKNSRKKGNLSARETGK
jgi:two-component system CheB/CheR fusion protein